MAKKVKSTKSKSSTTSSKKKSSTKLRTKVLTEEVQVQVVNEEPKVQVPSEGDLKAEAIGRLKVYLNRAAESLMSIKSDVMINPILAPDQIGQLNTVREIVTGLVKSLPKN